MGKLDPLVFENKISLCFHSGNLILSNVNKIFSLNISNGEMEKIIELPTNNYQKISKISSYLRRMLRTDVVSGTTFGDDLYLATKASLFWIDIKNKTYQNCTPRNINLHYI